MAVQPLKGSGVVLVNANGRGETRMCQADSTCAIGCLPGSPYCADGLPLRPAWSPDGRTLAVSAQVWPYVSEFHVVYPDGSCVTCGEILLEDLPGDAVFTNNPTLLITAGSFRLPSVGLSPTAVDEFGVDQLPRKRLLLYGVDPAWSSRNTLAAVRGGWIWVGSTGRLRRLTSGSHPSWSPDGRQLAFDRGGWVLVGPVKGGSFRRLVRGTAPAWSPDGRRIAFFGKSHRLNVIPAGGGRVRHVGRVTGRRVDWQPLPAKPSGPCLTPPGSSVIASSDTAILSVENVGASNAYPVATSAAMGCLRADGRERQLASYLGPPITIRGGQVAGSYAALVIENVGIQLPHGPQSKSVQVQLFDLRTGATVRDRGKEVTGCSPYPGTSCEIDQLVLGSDAVSAVHTTATNNGCTCTVEQIQASDSTGVHTLDSVTEPNGTPPALTNLTLTGDTLTWNNNGSPRSAQLQP